MTEAHAITMPAGGWTVDDLDRWPETHVRYELTDGALSVSPSPSSLHQAVAARMWALLDGDAPSEVAVTQAVEVRFGRQLTRIRARSFDGACLPSRTRRHVSRKRQQR